jgi:chromate reductase
MKVSIISGSSREENLTIRVAKAIKDQLIKRDNVNEVVLLDLRDNDFPSVGRKEIKPGTLSPYQENFIKSLKESSLVFICLPEYNWTTNPELINIFHQIGSKNFKACFEDKVFATAGVSNGRGGRMPCIQLHILLNKIISFIDAYGIVSPLLFESHETDKNIDENGNLLTNDLYNKTFLRFIDYSLQFSFRFIKR